jgi:hypothetical protein
MRESGKTTAQTRKRIVAGEVTKRMPLPTENPPRHLDGYCLQAQSITKILPNEPTAEIKIHLPLNHLQTFCIKPPTKTNPPPCPAEALAKADRRACCCSAFRVGPAFQAIPTLSAGVGPGLPSPISPKITPNQTKSRGVGPHLPAINYQPPNINSPPELWTFNQTSYNVCR